MRNYKILFLDIDGVLNTIHSFSQKSNKCIDIDKLQLLANIYNKCQCDIILSSSWRLDNNYKKYAVNKLKTIGIKLAGFTESLNYRDRCEEIELYLYKNYQYPVRVVILDDDRFAQVCSNDMYQVLFARTKDTEGLTETITNTIVSFFNEE